MAPFSRTALKGKISFENFCELINTKYTHIYIYIIYIYVIYINIIYIYVCVCVCECLCVIERESHEAYRDG